ncbi:Uncharacterised protein [Salmonella enterica]|nr:hypothetical protein CFSAN000624_020005 [Salmonella enterica subsp. enterica serovar Stanleyville str. CFSAN000624]AVU72955.1 hypothetical protein FORC58_4011 [Salmonella enterica subsp. enterica serovar Typhimurium]ESC12638.1 hypothetical protein SEES9712_04396 [Salmonella enterica subsp. enterica serovar Saintpaul str. 9712]ESF57115.1 hypothetical protein SEES2008_14009 [Salmonella enterica subsp. enterica serovar Saintpaul str. JO2008]ODA02956.1 hypothetical protein A7W94_11290 [Salmonell
MVLQVLFGLKKKHKPMMFELALLRGYPVMDSIDAVMCILMKRPGMKLRYTEWSELISRGIVPPLLMEFREWHVHAPCAATMSGV